MSKIKDLKTNPENVLNIVDVLELFSPDKKSKYTDTLLRLMKNTKALRDQCSDVKKEIVNTFPFITMEELDNFSEIQIMVMWRFIDAFFYHSDLNDWRKFCDYNERGLISQNDLTKYKTFEEISNQLSLADIKVQSKELENEVVKILDTDEWLLVRPLTYYSSKKYGSNTKWCTTSEGNPEYFIKYSSRGVLIYCINKITGYKVASFYSLDKQEPEFSFWNQKDTRVDSLDTELTDDIRKLIQDVSKDKDAKTNRFLLSDELRTKEDWSLREFSLDRMTREVMLEEPDAVLEQPRDIEINRNEAFQIRNEERAMREEVLLRTHTNG
jgi:hypothetical protein